MIEMLIVVAITVVLLSISIFALGNFATSLKMTELDNYAKTIYLEAQNQLSALEVEGGLSKLRESVPADRFLNVKPKDYKPADELYKRLCYVTKNDDYSAKLIPFTSDIYMNHGYYVIEFNPGTGDVYGVFYWESETAMNYADLVAMDRSRAARTAKKIGYYGGALNESMAATSALGQSVEIINGGESYLKITYDKESLRGINENDLQVLVSIVDEHEHTWEFDLRDITLQKYFGRDESIDTIEYYFLLDSMQEGFHFTDIMEEQLADGNRLVAGDELTVTVTTTLIQGASLEEADTIEGNVLFAVETTADTIYIKNVRNLRNMDYTQAHDSTDGTLVTIQIAEDIDFERKMYAWSYAEDGTFATYEGAGKADSPIQAFEPVSNVKLLTDSVISGAEGEKGTEAYFAYILNNFVIRPNESTGENVGLFAYAKNVTFKNIRLVDCIVDASDCNNVGALVGKVEGGSIDNCGIYVSSYEEASDGKSYYSQNVDEGCTIVSHENMMDHRYDTYIVEGSSYVGGLIGEIGGTATVSNSFAAVKVFGTEHAGGFIGNASDVTINDSYASGNVTSDVSVGGFIGRAGTGVSVTDAYSTGNVSASGRIGGFLGTNTSADNRFKNCTAYGKVLKDGSENVNGAAGVGGFVAVATENKVNGNTYDNCKYLMQSGHNKSSLIVDPSSIAKANYTELSTSTPNANLISLPYDADLFEQVFPFKLLNDQTEHYGDWPLPYVIDTSLVYYERYSDGKYGYYCVTSVTDSENTWVLNTLEDKECVEDGYGLLTKYNLDEINYQLRVGTRNATMADYYTNSSAYTTKGVVTREQADANKALYADNWVQINQQADLTFYAVDGHDFVNGVEGTRLDEEFTVSGLYLYQLPFELQCTDRSGVSYFYDSLAIYASAKGTDAMVIEGDKFLYCPHFAKTAVNPNVDGGQDPDNADVIYVRSARQLNQLGRYSYYWNSEKEFHAVSYKQETDINFSTYVKEYCGQEHDLQAFGKPYSNRPIGDPDLDETDKQFRNNYDGQYNKIIDFCVSSSVQFTGLFGEIQGATIENIVMVVSDDAKGNAGIVTSSFFEINLEDDEEDYEMSYQKRVGVGALIGLAYQDKNTVRNCTASGYTVQYVMNDAPGTTASSTQKEKDEGKPIGVSVGGLLGFGMSDISNCSATNDVKIILNSDYRRLRDGASNSDAGEGTVFLGGLAGSYFYATMSDCYAGGTIDVESNGYNIARLRIAGLCPGWMDTPAAGMEWDDGKVVYKNIYSYTKVADRVWDVTEGNSGNTKFTHYFPIISRMVCAEAKSSILGIPLGYWTTTYAPDLDVRVPDGSYSYYLSDTAIDHYEKLSSTEKRYFESWRDGTTINGKVCDSISYEALKNVEGLAQHRANITYTSSGATNTTAYPFPAVVTDENGNYVHYGDWAADRDIVVGNYPVYYEEYADGTYGYYYMRENGTLVTEGIINDKEINSAGYGLLTVNKPEGDVPYIDMNVPVYKEGDGATTNCRYYLSKMSYDEIFAYGEESNTETISKGQNSFKVNFDFGTVVLYDGVSTGTMYTKNEKSVHINPGYAMAIRTGDTLGTTEPLLVRTKEQLEFVGTTTEAVTIVLNRDVDLKDSNTSTNVNSGVTFKGNNKDNGYVILNAGTTVFGTNNGIITDTKVVSSDYNSSEVVAGFVHTNAGEINNCSVHGTTAYADVKVSGTNAYGFAVNNSGKIEKCFVVATVTGETEAAGFVGSNTGTIANCYANAQVVASDADATATGFAVTSQGTINLAYAAGSVNATNAYGFMENGNASNSYTINDISGTTLVGFATEGSNVTNCYWAYDGFIGLNAKAASPENTTTSAGSRCTLWWLQYINQYTPTAFAGTNTSDNYYGGSFSKMYAFDSTVEEEFSYPSIGMTHYGDCPDSKYHWYTEYLRKNEASAGIFYYEIYEDPVTSEFVYGIYAEGFSDGGDKGSRIEWMINSLREEVPESGVKKSGYGVFYLDDDWTMDVGSGYKNIASLGSEAGELFGYKFRILTDGGEVNSYSYSLRWYEYNFWGSDYTYLSGEITSDEIKTLRDAGFYVYED